MFADLCKYADADFCKEHPTIAFDTLSCLVKYEVVAAFKFNTNRESFKYNEDTLMDEVQFAEFMENVRARQLYDTGVTAEYGDQLLTLSTCEYTYANGRFVVVVKHLSRPADEEGRTSPHPEEITAVEGFTKSSRAFHDSDMFTTCPRLARAT